MAHPAHVPVSPGTVANLPLFDGFPYIVTRLVPAGYHILLLPDAWATSRLMDALQQQVAANQLDAALALGPSDAIYLSPGAAPAHSTFVPRSNGIFGGTLLPAVAFDPAALGDRPARLDAFRQAVTRPGFILGDPAAGGRPATAQEVPLYSGRRPDGVPRGLERCPHCQEWRGWCLRSVEAGGEFLVPVHCVCQNTTRCGACLQPFRERRVGGNQYDEQHGRLSHWPGFMALGHRCATSG